MVKKRWCDGLRWKPPTPIFFYALGNPRIILFILYWSTNSLSSVILSKFGRHRPFSTFDSGRFRPYSPLTVPRKKILAEYESDSSLKVSFLTRQMATERLINSQSTICHIWYVTYLNYKFELTFLSWRSIPAAQIIFYELERNSWNWRQVTYDIYWLNGFFYWYS